MQTLAFPVSLRSPARDPASLLDTRGQLEKRQVPPNQWFAVAQGGNAQSQTTYLSDAVQQAVNRGYQLAQLGLQIAAAPAPNGQIRHYPVYFGNRENLPNIVYTNDVRRHQLFEFPILPDRLFGDGDAQLQDRVVFDRFSGQFAGVITHRNMPDNGVRGVVAYNIPEIVITPPPDPPLYVPILGVGGVNFGGGGGSGELNL